MRAVLLMAAIHTIFTVCYFIAGDNMIAFPPPKKGQIRYIIHLAEQDDKSNYQFELMVGRD